MQLVEFKKNEIYCDTGIIAKKFEMQHARVVRAMETLIPKLDDFRVTGCHANQDNFNPKFLVEEKTYKNKTYTAYLLNKDCFILLAMRFDTKKAREWQGKFISAFNAMERHIALSMQNKKETAWLENRALGKIARKEETDVIKDFVEYATNQGSKSASFYYKHITNATYKALGLISQKKPKLRDMMNIYEIAELMLAERVARNSIKKYMELGRHYKDIYESVKDDLVAFSSGLKIGND